MTGDAIELRGLRALGHHGALEGEQDRAQPFEIDLDVCLDLDAAGRSDELGHTLDYAALAEIAVGIVTGERHRLIERIAQRIADEIMAGARSQAVSSVTVVVRKLRPPVPADLATAGVRITRP